jgi:hypothetical protein
MPFVSCAALDASQAPQDAAIAALQASQTAQDATIAALQAGAPVTAAEVAAAVDAMTPAQLADMCAKLNCPLSAAALTAALLSLPGAGVAGNVLTIVGGAPVFQAPVPGPATSVPAAGVQAGTLAPAVQLNDTANFGAGAAATDTALGVVENATTTEVSAGVLDGAVAISPKNLLDGLNAPGALKSAVSAIAAAAAPPPPVATDTVAGVTTLNQGTAAGDATDCNSALTACGLTAILNGTAPNASPNPLQLAVAQLPAKHIFYFPSTLPTPSGYLVANGQATSGCANAAATWGSTVPNLYSPVGVSIAPFASGFSNPHHMAQVFSGAFAGDFLVSNYAASTVSRVPAAGGAAVPFATGFFAPTGVTQIRIGAFAGDFLVSNFNGGTVSRVPAAGGAAVPFATGVTGPESVVQIETGAFAGDFLVANYDAGAGTTVFRIPAAGGAAVPFATGLSGPIGITPIPSGAFAGDFLVSNYAASTVSRVPAAGGAAVPFATGVAAHQIAYVETGVFAGDFLAAGTPTSTVFRLPAAGGAAVIFATGLSSPIGIVRLTNGAFAGDFIVSNNAANTVVRLTTPEQSVPHVKC